MIGIPAIVVLGAIVPWQITVVAPFRVAPVLATTHAAPDSGVIDRVLVREGDRVSSGSPLVVIRNLPLERELTSVRRSVDSLSVLSAQARGQGRQPELAVLAAHHAVEKARLSGLQERVEALRIRALSSGTVLTPRTAELTGRWVPSGEVVMLLGNADTVEVRILLSGAGASLIRPGSQVHLLPDARVDAPVSGVLTAVSVAGGPTSTAEARLQLPAAGAWRPGMTGRASVALRRSNAWGALWWSIRGGIRSDILL